MLRTKTPTHVALGSLSLSYTMNVLSSQPTCVNPAEPNPRISTAAGAELAASAGPEAPAEIVEASAGFPSAFLIEGTVSTRPMQGPYLQPLKGK